MSGYRVKLRPAASRALAKLDPPIRLRIQGAIVLLGEDPRPPASRRLKGRLEYRVRIGNYRILYATENDALLVIVITLGHRRDVYDR